MPLSPLPCVRLLPVLSAVALLAAPPADADYSFTLTGDNLIHYFPNAADTMNADYTAGMPPFYRMQPEFPATLSESVQTLVTDSLDRDGISHGGVAAAPSPAGGIDVTIKGVDQDDPVLDAFAGTLRRLLSDDVAGLALAGQAACVKSASRCWNPLESQRDSRDRPNAPWAFHLPLGMPMVNQKVLMYLNYPPSDALCAVDYFENFTMRRWTTVLQRVGIDQPALYETIADLHPIAAPGSGQSDFINETTEHYRDYNRAMIRLLSKAEQGSESILVVASGSDAREAWGKFIDADCTPRPGDIDVYRMQTTGGGTVDVPWLAANHPVATNYQACPGTNSRKDEPRSIYRSGIRCRYDGTTDANEDYYKALNDLLKDATADASEAPPEAAPRAFREDRLIEMEVRDLVAACTQRAFTAMDTANGTALERLRKAQSQCRLDWCANDGCSQRRQVCIQARLDYSYKLKGNCECEAAAVAFCEANADNACPDTEDGTAASCEAYNETHCSASDDS